MIAILKLMRLVMRMKMLCSVTLTILTAVVVKTDKETGTFLMGLEWILLLTIMPLMDVETSSSETEVLV